MTTNPNDKLAYDETFDCIQCGSCLPACPTYKTMGTETQSPRGRINLVKMAAEGKIALDRLQEPIDLCLGCRACERVCPTGVHYGRILESAKEALHEKLHEQASPAKRMEENLFYDQMFPKNRVLHSAGNLIWFYQKSGLRALARKTGMIHMLPENLETFERSVPDLPDPGYRHRRGRQLRPDGAPKLKIGFFTGCVMDTVFARMNDLGMRLLAACGAEVIAVEGQTCCGALHSHGGRRDQAKALAKQNIEAFEDESLDYVVNTAGGCGAMLHEYPQLFADDSDWATRAKRFSRRSVDISVILSKLKMPVKKAIHRRVTYQPSCHMTNVQKVVREPLDLMRQIEGLDIRPLDDPDFCCGSAGIYNVVNFAESMNILDVKMKDVKEKAPDLIVTTNPGCLLQMLVGIERAGMGEQVRAVHLVELLAEACAIQ